MLLEKVVIIESEIYTYTYVRISYNKHMCVCACVCVCVRACVRACVTEGHRK